MSKLVALVVFAVAAGLAPVQAQSPSDRYQREQCQSRIRAWQQAVDRFNAECGSVAPGSDQARSCAARRTQLQASRPNC